MTGAEIVTSTDTSFVKHVMVRACYWVKHGLTDAMYAVAAELMNDGVKS